MINSVCPVFAVKNVQATADWYHSVLGFEMSLYPEYRPCFGILSRDKVEVMVQEREDFIAPTGIATQWDAYFRLSGQQLPKFYQQIEGKVKVIRALEKAFYGITEFEIVDCNGYVLCFSELLPEDADR